MPELSSEEDNIEQLLNHFGQKGLDCKIIEWRQRIEADQAKEESRSTRSVSLQEIFTYFREALALDPLHPEISEEDHALSESARALLSDLIRAPRQLSLLRVWEIQAAEHRPLDMSPAEQAYCEPFDRAEAEAAKLDMHVPPERIRQWNQLAKTGQHLEVYKDQVALFNEWMDAHPEQAEELVRQFAEPGAPPRPEISESQQFYHWSGLYWLAANVVFQRFGLGEKLRDEIAQGVFARMKHFWPELQRAQNLDPARREALDSACGEAYMQAHQRLSRAGADTIEQLEHWLVATMHRLLKGGRLLDPEKRRKERRAKKKGAAQKERFSEEEATCTAAEEDEGVVGSTPEVDEHQLDREELDPCRDLQRAFCATGEEGEALDLLPGQRPVHEATSADDPSQTAELTEFLSTLPARHRAVFGDLRANPTLTNEDLASFHGLTPRRIAQILDEVLYRWNHR
jgi:hypothetical protein